MTTKKVLLMAGLLAAIGIAYWAFNGTPVEDGEEGAVGSANRYRAEQMSDSDVNLEDAEVIALLQDDVFLELIQDEDFQNLMARQGVADALARYGVEGIVARAIPSVMLAHEDVVALTRIDDMAAIAGKSQIVEAFEAKKMKIEPVDVGGGKKGPKDDVALARNIDYAAFRNELVGILGKNAKFASIDPNNPKGPKVKLGAAEVADMLARSTAIKVMADRNTRVLFGKQSYQQWGRSANIKDAWQGRHVKMLKAMPDVADLDKNWKADFGKSADVEAVWGKNTDLLMRQGIKGLYRNDAVAYFDRAKVRMAMRTSIEAGNFRTANDVAAFSKRLTVEGGDIGGKKRGK